MYIKCEKCTIPVFLSHTLSAQSPAEPRGVFPSGQQPRRDLSHSATSKFDIQTTWHADQSANTETLLEAQLVPTRTQLFTVELYKYFTIMAELCQHLGATSQEEPKEEIGLWLCATSKLILHTSESATWYCNAWAQRKSCQNYDGVFIILNLTCLLGYGTKRPHTQTNTDAIILITMPPEAKSQTLLIHNVNVTTAREYVIPLHHDFPHYAKTDAYNNDHILRIRRKAGPGRIINVEWLW